MSRPLKWIGITFGALLGLVLVAILVLLLFDWNRLRGPVSSLVSERLGRHFAINGDMRMDWSWTPRLTVNGIELDNAAWGSQPHMFTLDRAVIALHLPDLFKGHIVLPEIEITKPRLALEKNRDGAANWEFGPPDKGKEKDSTGLPISRRWFPKIDQLAIDDGRMLFSDPAAGTELDMNVSTAMGESDERGLKLVGRGRLQKERFNLEVRGGSVLDLWNTERPFPLDVKLVYGPTEAKVGGTIQEPLKLEGPDLRFEAHGPDLAALRPFTRAWIPETGAYRFAGRVSRQGEQWRVRDFAGKLGNSDLSGSLMFTLRDERPFLAGDLESKKLDFRDFAGFIGANPKSDAPPRPKLLPDQPYDVAGLRVADADIRFKSANIVTPLMPVDEVLAHLKMERGVLSLKPASASIGLGQITSNINLDARENKILARVEARIDKVPFKRLVSKTPFADQTAGLFFGKVDLTTAGNSVAAMAAAADGGITVVMENGRVAELMMELAGVDIFESLGIVVTGDDDSVAAPCTIVDFIVTDGLLKTKLFLMDTTDTNLFGDGQLNLRDETLDFRFTAHPKDVSLFVARTPILVTGTLKQPRPRPEILPLAARVGASIALGVVAPPAIILPWLELGLGQDSPCRALVKAAERQESTPVPGKGKPKGRRR
ncbi:AsmA family protein [Methylomagnum sp.]